MLVPASAAHLWLSAQVMTDSRAAPTHAPQPYCNVSAATSRAQYLPCQVCSLKHSPPTGASAITILQSDTALPWVLQVDHQLTTCTPCNKLRRGRAPIAGGGSQDTTGTLLCFTRCTEEYNPTQKPKWFTSEYLMVPLRLTWGGSDPAESKKQDLLKRFIHSHALHIRLEALKPSAFECKGVAAVNCSHKAHSGSRDVAYHELDCYKQLRAMSHSLPLGWPRTCIFRVCADGAFSLMRRMSNPLLAWNSASVLT